jgi:FkbM family methyltransferase
MIVRHFDTTTPRTKPPQSVGWQPTWHGYWEMTQCENQHRKAEYIETDRVIHKEGMITEVEFERDCLLSILSDIKHKKVNMFELGAGWGRMSLAMAGAIDFKIIPMIPVSYRCLAVEAEPTHYKWLKEHFEAQKINGIAVQGAVSNKSGFCHFDVNDEPDSQYGQAIIPIINRYNIPSIGNVINVLKKRTVKVPVFTIDQLIKLYDFDHVDIVDIDVQGAEYKVMKGAAESIGKDKIDYLLIGTHQTRFNDDLSRLLSPKFDLVVNIYPDTPGSVRGFAPVKTHDGIQLFRRKNF